MPSRIFSSSRISLPPQLPSTAGFSAAPLQRHPRAAPVQRHPRAAPLRRRPLRSTLRRQPRVMASCGLTICSILIRICLGAKIPDELIVEIEEVLKDVMKITMPKLPDFLPLLTPLFRKQLAEARDLRRRQLRCLAPLVRTRREFLREGTKTTAAAGSAGVEMVSGPGEACVDSLFDLEPPGRGKRLGEEELVTLCRAAPLHR